MSKNNLKEQILKIEDKKNHFSIRKLTIGAASVLIGTTFFLNSNSVKADTLPASEQTENTQNNLDNKDKLDTTTLSKVQVENNSDLNQTNDSSTISTSDVNGLQPNQYQEKNTEIIDQPVTTSNNQSSQEKDSKIDGTALTETKTPKVNVKTSESLPNNTDSTWPQANVTDWETSQDGDNLEVTNYIGNNTEAITIPNTADFINAGKLKEGQKAEISSLNMRRLATQSQNIAISKTDDAKLYAKDSDWSYILSDNNSSIDIGGTDNDSNKEERFKLFEENNLRNILDLKKLDLSNFETSNITNMTNLFAGQARNNGLIEVGDISNWNTSNVTSTAGMFEGDYALSQPLDLSKWDMSSNKNMQNMFYHTESLPSIGDISNWNTSKVESTYQMFVGTLNLKTQMNLSKWDMSSNKNAGIMFMMTGITHLDISNWDLSNLEYNDLSSNLTKSNYQLVWMQNDGNQADYQEVIASNIKSSGTLFLGANAVVAENTQANINTNGTSESIRPHVFYLKNDNGDIITVTALMPTNLTPYISKENSNIENDIGNYLLNSVTSAINDGSFENESNQFQITGMYNGYIPIDVFSGKDANSIDPDSPNAAKFDISNSKYTLQVNDATDFKTYLAKFLGISGFTPENLMVTPDKTTYTDRPVLAEMSGVITSSYSMGIPETQPSLPAFEGGVAGIPESQASLPAFEGGVAGIPESQASLPAFEGGVAGIPDSQASLPKFEGGVAGIPDSQASLPAFEGGVAGIPDSQASLPAFEDGVAGIPLVEEALPEYDGPIKSSDPTKTEIIPNDKDDDGQLGSPLMRQQNENVENGLIIEGTEVIKNVSSKRLINNKQATDAKTLPQTGSKNNNLLLQLGMTVISLATLLGFTNKKKN